MREASSKPAEKPKAVAPSPFEGSTRFRSLSDPESLREFAKNLREGIYISTRDGRLLDSNGAFLEMFGVVSLRELGEFGASSAFVDPERRTAELLLLERQGSLREFEIE